MRNERFEGGVCVYAEIIDFDAGTFTVEDHGEIVEGPRPLTVDEYLQYGPQPLDPVGASATLNVVLGLWTLDDAANAVGLSAEALVHEAQAWALGGGL